MNSELASVEKLREWLHTDAYEHSELMAIVDEIEREVSERFMELPEGWTTEQASEVLDLWPRWDDGSPCMFGDEFTCYPKYDREKKYEVFDKLTIFWKNHVWNRGEDKEKPHDGGFYEWNYMRPGGDGCEEYRPTKRKPRTIEDVLCDMIHEYGSSDALTETIAAKYADELRGMMEAD